MNRSIFLHFLLFLFTLSLFLLNGQAIYAVNFPPGRVLFSPTANLETEIDAFIRTAQTRVLLFTENITSDDIITALIETRNLRAIPVRLLLPVALADHERIQRLRNGRVEVVTNGGSRGFTGTFIEVDGRNILYTPQDISYAALHTKRNYTMIIDSHLLAENFLNEFNEMFTANSYGTTSPTVVANPHIIIANTVTESYFLPENDPSARLDQQIEAAKSSIKIVAEHINSRPLAEKLVAKNKSGVPVTIIVGKIRSEDESIRDFLRYNGVDLFEKTEILDQSEILSNYLITDDRWLVIMPQNWFTGVTLENDSQAFLFDSTETVKLFLAQFNELKGIVLRGISIRGYVSNVQTGKIIPNSTVTVQDSGSISYSDLLNIIPDSGLVSYTDRFGIYSFKNLGTGELLLNVSKDGFFTTEQIVPVTSTVKRLDFKITPIVRYGSIHGRILNSNDKKPIVNAEIIAEYIEVGSGVVTQVRDRSGPEGWFKLTEVPEGNIRLRALSTDHYTVTPQQVTVRHSSQTDLDYPIYMSPKYLVSVMPNPIFPNNLFITLQSANSALPVIIITQNNHIAIPVSMRRTDSDSNEVHLFTGSYKIANGYWGETVVDINNGESRYSFELGFIEAGSRYTFYAPANSRVDFSDVSGSQGVITAFAEQITSPPEFSVSSAPAVRISGPAGTTFSEESRIIFKKSGVGGRIYQKLNNNQLIPLDSTTKGDEISAEFPTFGTFCVLSDVTPPQIILQGANLHITDAGSGVKPSSIRITTEKKELAVDIDPTDFGFRITPHLTSTRPQVVEISASDFDNNNNQLQMILNPAILTPANATVSLYPNPIQGIGMLTVVTRVTPATSVKMIIRDVFGTTVFQELRDISSTRHTFQWNLRNQKDKMVANGTYFIEIINPITGEKLCRGKAALLR